MLVWLGGSIRTIVPSKPSPRAQNHRRSFTMWLGLYHIGRRKPMSITAHSWTGGDTGTAGRLPMLVPPLAALLYPFALKGFNISVTHLESGSSPLSWLSAAACLALAFAMPLIAMLAAMSFSEIGRPTVAQLRAKRTALLAVAAPTLFTFVGVVLLHDPVPDTWLWIACWAIALALLLRSDNG